MQQVAAQPQGASASAQQQVRGDYPLGVGDYIRIQVHGEEDLKLETRLVENGTISYPLLGEIRVLGLTTGELEKKVADGLRGDYLVNPDVQVTVIEYRHFYINGEVKNPGGYQYIPGLTVQKAAALAGGFTERASTGKMFVLRENDSKNRQEQVNLDSPVYPGDTLIIEEGLF